MRRMAGLATFRRTGAMAATEHLGEGPLLFLADATEVALVDLLRVALEQTNVVDVESHRPPIDGVVADLYEHWNDREER